MLNILQLLSSVFTQFPGIQIMMDVTAVSDSLTKDDQNSFFKEHENGGHHVLWQRYVSAKLSLQTNELKY